MEGIKLKFYVLKIITRKFSKRVREMSSQLFVTAHLTIHDRFFIDVLPKGAVDVKQGTQARC